MSLNFLTMGVAGFIWGTPSDRCGARAGVLSGSVLLGLALVLASQAATLQQFQLIFGILVGLSARAFFAPMIATTTLWFLADRSLAVSLVTAGMGVAPMTISPFAGWLISRDGWRPAMLSIGILVWLLLVPAASLVRRPGASASIAPAGAGATSGEVRLSAAQALCSPQFLVLALTFFFAAPPTPARSYAIGCGVPGMAAVTNYGVEGLAGLGQPPAMLAPQEPAGLARQTGEA